MSGKTFKRIFSILTALCLMLSVTASTAVSAAEYTAAAVRETDTGDALKTEIRRQLESAEALQASAKTNNNAGFTLMIYMCGADLESIGEYGTADIKEICKGYKKGKLNIIIQTGGASEWHHKSIKGKNNRRFKVTEKGITPLVNLGDKNMGSKNTLYNFVSYCSKNYPADRYGLIFWNHGGGTLGGVCADENYDNDTLSLLEISDALDKAKVHFDFIGFDACLMATLETCLITEKYADYMIASEQNEPAAGWYYTRWITALSKNTKTKVTSLGKMIADDYVKHESAEYSNIGISVIELDKVRSEIIPALDNFSKQADSMLTVKKYDTVAKLRYRAGGVGGRTTEIVDLQDIAYLFKNEGLASKAASRLNDSVKNAVVYETDAWGSDSGISLTFPFNDLKNLDELLKIYERAECETLYLDFLKRFANIMAGGQEYYDPKAYDYSNSSWYDEKEFYAKNYYDTYYLDDDEISLKAYNGNYVIPLTATQRSFICGYEMNMCSYKNNGKTIIKMGNEPVHSFDDNGNLIVGYSGYWASVNGVMVPSYNAQTMNVDGVAVGLNYIPCKLESRDFGYSGNAYVYYISVYPYLAEFYAWSPVYDDGTVSSVLYSLYSGNKITPVLEYCSSSFETYRKVYSDTTITLNSKSTVTYEYAPEKLGNTLIYYTITDIFNNKHITKPLYY